MQKLKIGDKFTSPAGHRWQVINIYTLTHPGYTERVALLHRLDASGQFEKDANGTRISRLDTLDGYSRMQ